MDLLPEEICLVCQENLCTFDLPQIEYQGWNFLGRRAGSVGKTLQKITEGRCLVDYIFQYLLFVWLEGECWDLSLPLLQILEFWASSITRDLPAPVTDGAGVFIEFLDFPPRNLQAFAVIPALVSDVPGAAQVKK